MKNKIAVVLPLTENYSLKYSGAVSLFIKEYTKISRYQYRIYGNTDKKDIIDKNYINVEIGNSKLTSSNVKYSELLVKEISKFNPDIIEIHNRPQIAKILKEKTKKKIILHIANDPLSLRGSSLSSDREYLLENIDKIIFVSSYIKDQFFKNINFKNTDKTQIVYHGISKENKFPKKNKNIIFVGKLNTSKGYDIFGKASIQILEKFKDWTVEVVGDEPREKINFTHKRFKNLGWLNYQDTIKRIKKSSICVIPSRWEEPLGRVAIESGAVGCATIISNKGGLPETLKHKLILNTLSVKSLYDAISKIIKNKKLRNNLQVNAFKNHVHDLKKKSKELDVIRDKLINKKININFNKPIKIIHIADTHIRHNGRLYYSTSKKINNGFLMNGYNVLTISDRDILSTSKNIYDLEGKKKLSSIVLSSVNNFKPDLIMLGHADNLPIDPLEKIRKNFSDIKISQWFLDPLIKTGPDYIKNKNRILSKKKVIDTTFLTTSPEKVSFLSSNSFFIPNPADPSIDTNCFYNNPKTFDIFIAISHGQHRGTLKNNHSDPREKFINNIVSKSNDISFKIFGMNNAQPIWGDEFFEKLSKCRLAINISRGEPIKYYSSDRITSTMANGVATICDKKYNFQDFFNNNELITYENDKDLLNKINFYKKNEKKLIVIGKKGREKYFKLFNNKLVTNYMVKKSLGIKSTKFFWMK